jgi:hypothetical protein
MQGFFTCCFGRQKEHPLTEYKTSKKQNPVYIHGLAFFGESPNPDDQLSPMRFIVYRVLSFCQVSSIVLLFIRQT